MGGGSSFLLVCWFVFIVSCADHGGCVAHALGRNCALLQATIKNMKQ